MNAETRTVTLRLVDKQVISTKISRDEATTIVDELTATWTGGEQRSITINDPSGVTVLINPHHVTSVETR